MSQVSELTLALNNNWLTTDTREWLTMTSGSIVGYSNSSVSYQYPSYVYWTTPAPRPIQLSMAEVERLRKAAKADEKLKAVLAKFTSQIEVVVDFET